MQTSELLLDTLVKLIRSRQTLLAMVETSSPDTVNCDEDTWSFVKQRTVNELQKLSLEMERRKMPNAPVYPPVPYKAI
jgi:hypothetical protein